MAHRHRLITLLRGMWSIGSKYEVNRQIVQRISRLHWTATAHDCTEFCSFKKEYPGPQIPQELCERLQVLQSPGKNVANAQRASSGEEQSIQRGLASNPPASDQGRAHPSKNAQGAQRGLPKRAGNILKNCQRRLAVWEGPCVGRRWLVHLGFAPVEGVQLAGGIVEKLHDARFLICSGQEGT